MRGAGVLGQRSPPPAGEPTSGLDILQTHYVGWGGMFIPDQTPPQPQPPPPPPLLPLPTWTLEEKNSKPT